VIDQIFNHLRDHVAIRTGKPTAEGSPRPLGVFLLVGSEGVGKRYLTTCLCEQLWVKGILITLDLAEEVPDHTTEMLAALSANPCATVLLENVDRATGRTLDRLTRILADGRGRDPSSGAVIELGNALIVMTSTRGIAAFKEQSEDNTSSIQERLAAETPMDHPLLAQFDVIAACRRLDAWTRAEVVALIMKRECRRHGLELGYVAPEFLTREVAAINDAHGMALIPPRIARLLRVPLTKAVNAGITHLDLN
jgi:ATP-dependent Clp protease ATP-binding subunit ClpA